MSGVSNQRKLPFRISEKLWPEEWMTIWLESPVVANWPVGHRGRVKQALGRFLAYADFADLPINPKQSSIEGFKIILQGNLSRSSVVTYMELLAYGLLVLFPEQEWLWLQGSNRALRAKTIRKCPIKPKKVGKKECLRLPIEKWSIDEQSRWTDAFQDPEKLKPKRYLRRHERQEVEEAAPVSKENRCSKHPSKWSPAFCSRVERGWGMFRQWCLQTREDHMTPEAFSRFAGDCAHRGLSTVSVASYAFEAYRAGSIMYPEHDWSLHRACCTELEETAVPTKDKLQTYVSPDQLFDFSIDLMNGASTELTTTTTATKYRDGLFLALICREPKRVGNLGSIVIGENLLLNNEGLPEQLYFPTTKNGDDSTSAFPHELIPYYQEWMERFRPCLLKSEPDTGAMWIGRDGNPFGTYAFWAQLTKRTKKKFGKAIGPHMVRSCFATFFAEKGPEFMPFVQRALDHRDCRSIRHYQLISKSVAAGRELDQALDPIRRDPPARRATWQCHTIYQKVFPTKKS